MIGAGQDPAFMSDRDLWKKRLSDQNYLSRVSNEVLRILKDDNELEGILADNSKQILKILRDTKDEPLRTNPMIRELIEKEAEDWARIRIRPGDIDEE